MNTSQTVQKMKSLHLTGMVQAYDTCLAGKDYQTYSPDELLTLLIDAEWQERENKRITRVTENASFRQRAYVSDIKFTAERLADKDLIMRLATGNFIQARENILISGPTGVGKSFIASALGHQACSLGYKTIYYHTAKLFQKLYGARADNTLYKELLKIEKHDLLILDDFGLQNLEKQHRDLLMEIIEDRHNGRSTIIASQLPVNQWYNIIGEGNIADAILDRLVHTAHRITLTGESMRKKAKA